jgi:hypothetical protein
LLPSAASVNAVVLYFEFAMWKAVCRVLPTITSRGCAFHWVPQVFSGVRVTRSLVLYVCFVDRCLSFCTFSFGHCVVCSSSIYRFWFPLWYLQTLLKRYMNSKFNIVVWISSWY